MPKIYVPEWIKHLELARIEERPVMFAADGRHTAGVVVTINSGFIGVKELGPFDVPGRTTFDQGPTTYIRLTTIEAMRVGRHAFDSYQDMDAVLDEVRLFERWRKK